YGLTEPIVVGPVLNVQGWSGVGAAGYNLQSGSFVMGVELSGRLGNERANALTAFTQAGFLGPVGFTTQYRAYNDAAVHLAARAGMAIDNTFIFGKVGLGAAEAKGSISFLPFGRFCTTFAVVNGAVVCTNSEPNTLPGPLRQSVANWYPSVNLGVGVEQN